MLRRLLLTIFPLFIYFNHVIAADIKFDLLSNERISVLNTNNFSTRVIVFYGSKKILDKVLAPNEKNIFHYTYDRSTIGRYNYKAVYDDEPFINDINILKRIKQKRDQGRQKAAFWKALGAFVDEAFFDGTFSTLFEIGNYGRMLFNGASEEEWAAALYDTGISYGIDKQFDKNYEKGLAAAVYSFGKSMVETNYNDLQDWLVYYMKKREKGYIRQGLIIETARLPFKRIKKYPNISISSAISLQQKFSEDNTQIENDLISLDSDLTRDALPLEFRLAYNYRHSMGIFFEYGNTNTIINRDNSNFKYLRKGEAMKFTTYSLGISPSISWLELGMGVSYLRQQNFLLDRNSQNLLNNPGTNKIGGFFEPRINLNSQGKITVFGSWRYNFFGDKNLENMLLSVSNFKVGVALNFRKKYLDFSR